LRGFGRDFLDVVQHQRFGGVLDEVEHVVHARDQPVDFIAIEWGDEGGVQQLHGLVGDAIGAMLGVLDLLDARGAIGLVVVVAKHVGERHRALHDELGVAIEQTEEAPLARHQARDEVH
jgi:hypothetical protein